MFLVLIGLTVGLVMGLTGAGGAMISIPLFVQLLGVSLKEATVLSLIAVILGTVINLLGNYKDIDWKTALILSLSGMFSNYLSLSIKEIITEGMMAIFLIIIVLYSLKNVWIPTKINPTKEKKNELVYALISGFALGLLTTMTGLGGGVILIPLLMSVFAKSYGQALPTSLTISFIISVTALLFQMDLALNLIKIEEVFYMLLGAISSFVFLKIVSKQFSTKTLEIVRKSVFTMVATYSIIGVLIKIL